MQRPVVVKWAVMDTQVASSFEEYQAVRRRAGYFDYSGRGKISVTGPDRVTFLQSMISNEVASLAEKSGNFATFLTARGKMVCVFHVYKLADRLLLDLEGGEVDTVIGAFEKFIIMDDVRLEDATPRWGHLSLQGPATPELVRALFSQEPPDRLSMKEVEFEGERGWLIGLGRFGQQGCDILFPPTATESMVARLEQQGVSRVHSEAQEILRIEAASPRWGWDMDSDNNPLEARLDAAVSLTKGCYSGQEVVSKATYVGGVGRFLSCLVIDGEEAPERGAPIFDPEGRAVGKVTSTVYSPAVQSLIGLGYLRRSVSSPDQRISVELPSKTRVSARVVARFSA